MAARPETERLFQYEVPSVPYTTTTATTASLAPPSPSFQAQGSTYQASTIDESVWETIKRDIVTIGRNLRSVLVPVQGKFSQQEAALRNWDLWGPLVFILSLSIAVSRTEADPSTTFATVFTIVGAGAVVLTVNVVLLGGEIVFLQSLCLLGYCLFPLVVAAIVVAAIGKVHALVMALIVVLSVGWSSAASIPFISQTVPSRRRTLAIYPVVLLYTTIAWFIASGAVPKK